MKRILSLILTLALVLGLAGCGQKAETAAGANTPTWQEQYDLGIRYLSEGNYQEAIIAFTAAIEIDPKRPEAYIGLADVYTAQGDTEKALETLNKALELLGDNAAISAALEALSVSGSPETAPEIPAVLQHTASGNGYGWGMTEYEDNNYLVLTESAAAALQGLISAGLSGDPNTALAAFQSVTPEQFRADFGGLMTSGGDLPALYDYGDSETGGTTMYFWTVWNGDLIGCRIESASWADSVTLEYRAAAGTGFSACWADDHDGNSSAFSYHHSDAMSGWLYNGAFTGVTWQWTDGVLDQTFQFEGGAADELLQGAYTEEDWDIRYDEDGVAYRSIIRHYVFEAGQMTNAWSDPITGEPCCMMRERVSADGGIIETGYLSAEEETMSHVAYVSTGPYFW